MFYNGEMHFLCCTLKRNHIRALVLGEDNVAGAFLFDDSEYERLGIEKPEKEKLGVFIRSIKENTLYKTTDSLGRSFCCILLPQTKERTVLLIGPYLARAYSSAQILEFGESVGITPLGQKYLGEYYQSLALMPSDSPLFSMIETFCELIFKTRSYAVEEGLGVIAPPPVISGMSDAEGIDDMLVNMKAMEARYAFENELIESVTLGQLQRENQILGAFSETDLFEKRVQDPLRNVKNYCIIMNTLLRKAAEEGGVHPVYIDQVSSQFAVNIERMSNVGDTKEMMVEIFRGYCRLVRRHSMKGYSLAVQKAVLIIDSDLSRDLSLSTLAEAQGISPGYLSSIFKRDTGKTVSEYVRERRISHAAHLLASTQLQIQTVALYCGIVDVQYFSKTFKRQMGMTPKAYRESAFAGK